MHLSLNIKTLFGTLIAAALFIFSYTAYASHFQYAHINWKPGAGINEIEFTIQSSWRRSAYPGRCVDLVSVSLIACPGGLPAVGDVIAEVQGGTQFDPGDGSGLIGSTLGPLLYLITGINPITDSIFGLAVDPASLPAVFGDPVDTSISHFYPIITTTPTTRNYTAAISDCCRNSATDGANKHINNPGGSFRIETIVNVGPTVPNSSPISTMPEVVLCRIGSVCEFTVPGIDPDDDLLTFRLSLPGESAGIVQPSSPESPGNNASIDEDSGLYSWNTTGADLEINPSNFNILYSTQVTIEDATSKAAVDFFIQLVSGDSTPPGFTDNLGAVCGTTQTVSVGATLAFEVEVEDTDPADIIALTVVGLSGDAVLDPSLPIGGTLSLSSAFSWTPQEADVGPHVITFNALTSSGGQATCVVEIIVEDPLQTSDDTARDVPTPEGPDIQVVDIDVFEQIASFVVSEGSTNADFCVAPDPRERFIVNGSGSKGKGKGSDNGSGGASVFQPRELFVSELADTGTCTGVLDFPDKDFANWGALLAQIDLTISPRYRGFVGVVDGVEAVWLTIGVVRSTAEYDGPVAIVGFPEALINYDATPKEQRPVKGDSDGRPHGACENETDWRPLGLGGPVAAFGEFENVEGNSMIVETVQCNRSWALTRRTTHVFPVRLDGPGGSSGKENENLRVQLDGIQGTLDQASFCTNPDLIEVMQDSLDDARNAVAQKRYDDAISALERISRDANNDDEPEFDDGDKDGFNQCPQDTNYRGNFISRGLSAAFTVWDRFLHPDGFALYLFPNDVGVKSPILP